MIVIDVNKNFNKTHQIYFQMLYISNYQYIKLIYIK